MQHSHSQVKPESISIEQAFLRGKTESLDNMLKALGLLAIRDSYNKVTLESEKLKLSYDDYLYQLIEIENQARHQKYVDHLLKLSKLPRNKLLSDFDLTRLPSLSPSIIKRLAEGEFIDKAENLLIFGNPGTGKTHLAIAFAREWCLARRSCLYITAANLVQILASSKLNNKLTSILKSLDRKEVLIIDDISYVPYNKTETDLLFLLLAERYEQRSTLITSNLAFSGWNQIFKDEMTTAAAIDRLVHHSSILELNSESYRIASAKNKQFGGATQTNINSNKEHGGAKYQESIKEQEQ